MFPPHFFVAFGPQISGPPLFLVVDFAVLRRKAREKERKKREGKERETDVSARVFRGMCLAPCWLLGEAGARVMFKENRSPRAPRGARGASSTRE